MAPAAKYTVGLMSIQDVIGGRKQGGMRENMFTEEGFELREKIFTRQGVLDIISVHKTHCRASRDAGVMLQEKIKGG